MAYSKQTWVTGDTITAEKLNHMEDGIDAGGSNYLLKIVVDSSSETGFEITGPDFDEILEKVIDGTATAQWKNINSGATTYFQSIGVEGYPDDDPSEAYFSCDFYNQDVYSIVTLYKNNRGVIRMGSDDYSFDYAYSDGVYTCTFSSGD